MSFEQEPASDAYPKTNTWEGLIGRREPPWRPAYLKAEVDEEIGKILDRSDLVKRWLSQSTDRPSAVAVDAPVAFALEGLVVPGTSNREQPGTEQPGKERWRRLG